MAQQTSVATPERFAQGLRYEKWLAAIDRNRERFQENYEGTRVSDEDTQAFRELVALPNGPARRPALGRLGRPRPRRACPRSSP